MGYAKIPNLYKDKDVLAFNQVYAMEKIHGTSANIKYVNGEIVLFPGGEKYNVFAAMFDLDDLQEKFKSLGHDYIVIYGEAYGGSQQRMSETYGPVKKFVAFEVELEGRRKMTIGGKTDYVKTRLFMDVPRAEKIVNSLGLEFVHYVLGPGKDQTMIEFLDEQRDKPSTQAVRNGVTEPRHSEGIVIRPIIEVTLNNGARVMAKHKRKEFRETKKERKVSTEKLEVVSDASAVAREWAVEMRLRHVVDKLKANGKLVDEAGLPRAPKMEDTRTIIYAMIEDVKIEGEGEIEWSKAVESAIGRETARILKNTLHTL